MKIIEHAYIVSLGSNHQVIEDGAVAYDHVKIHGVGTTSQIRDRFPEAERHNANGRVLTPGLINAHMHLYSTFARGISLKDLPPKNFVQILERLWWRLDRALRPNDLYFSAIVPILDAVRSGVTTIIDHHASPNALGGSLDILKAVFSKCGLRGCLSYEISDRDGASRRDAGLEENAACIRGLKLHDTRDIAALIGIHASFTVEDSTLMRISELSKALKCGVHIHVAEDFADLEDARKRGFRSVVDRLHKFQLTGPANIFAHCVHVDSADIQTLAFTHTNVVHNPRSNMGNAVGCANIEAMMQEKVKVALGTDGFSVNPLQDLAVANILHKHQAKDPGKIYGEIWKMFSQNNPTLASSVFKQPIGVIEEHAAPDLVIWDYRPCTPMVSENTLGHFLFGISNSTVHTTICKGHTIYANHRLTFMDDEEELEIAEKSKELAKDLWERF